MIDLFIKRITDVSLCCVGSAPQASLLCSLEKEQRGHLIAESRCMDGLLQDEGTQTYNFLSAPFLRNTSLADLTAAKPLELHLQLQVESVTSRHHKASSAFTFLCGHTFKRREYGKHYKWVLILGIYLWNSYFLIFLPALVTIQYLNKNK